MSFYITTPIYYVNGAPHIGHAYTTVVADAFARHYRQRGDDVFFMTGTDEHGLKVQREAEAQGVTPQQLADTNSDRFRALFDELRLSHDRFIRTTEDEHRETVHEVVRRMKDSGDIYKGKYEGWYAASDEAYYDEDEIEDGRAKATGAEVEWVEEESYFFKLSAYQDRLLDWYGDDAGTVAPQARHNEVRSFVEGGLEDLSITRTTFEWGIPYPDDEEHVLYVWVDALTNYITGVGAFRDEAAFEKFWPCDVHLIGKDILRFHAVYWPAFLMSAGLEPPKQVFAHGWWTVEGEKMSKSKGNWLDAFELAEQYDLDVLRYYMLREIPLGNDGNFVKARIVERNNSELADNLGNLVNRVTKMTQGFLDGVVPEYVSTDNADDDQLRAKAHDAHEVVVSAMDDRETHRALDAIMNFGKELNNYVQSTQPWKENKEGNAARVQQILYHALEGIRWTAVLAYPFIPEAAHKILAALGQQGDEALSFQGLEWGSLADGVTVEPPDVLFAKLELSDLVEDTEVDEEEKKREAKKEKKAKSKKKEKSGMISFGEFQNLELRVGLIESAEPVEGADKLLKLSVDLGEDERRTVVAGLAKSFEPSELEGRRVAMVANLEPAKIFGIESQAMVLAADTADGKLALASFGDDVAPGTRIS